MTSLYKGFLIESMNNEIYGEFSKNDELYIGLNKRLYKLIDNNLMPVHAFERTPNFAFFNDGVWINFSSDESSIFYDLFENNLSHSSINEWIASHCRVINDKIVGFNLAWGNRYLFLYSLKDASNKKISGSFSYINVDNNYIFSRERIKGLYCFDENLNEIWHQDLGGHSYSKADQTPMFDKELVILNHSKSILAFNKNTGVSEWKFEINKPPGCFSVKNGKVYLTDGLDIKILDAQSGKLLINEPSGYQEIDSPGNETEVGVFFVNDDLLYVFARYHSNLKFLTSDAKTCLQELDLFSHGYGTGDIHTPIINGDTVVQGISNGGAYTGNGLLILQPANINETPAIKKQGKLPTAIYAVPSLHEEHIQRVFIEGDRIDDICRFVGITIQELNFETGIIPLYSEKIWSLDRKHNGEIELVVDPEPLEENAKSELNTLIEELNETFNEQPAYSGDGKHPIKVTLILQRREEWCEQGDLIEVDKLRKIQKPIS